MHGDLLYEITNVKGITMPKMRTYTFFDGDKTETKESTSYKKAVKSYQGGTKSKLVRVEWEAKKGGVYENNKSYH